MIAKEDKIVYKKLGSKIKKLREDKGLSLRKLAAVADIKHPQLFDIENGKRDLRLSTLLKVARAMNISAHELLNIE